MIPTTPVAPTLARTDTAAVEVLAAWHGLALSVAGAIDLRDARVAAVVDRLERALGLPRPATADDRWPLLARRFARAHRSAIRDVHTTADAAIATDLAVTAAAELAGAPTTSTQPAVAA
jgi:hypothetical protein